MKKRIKLYAPGSNVFMIPQPSDVERLKSRGYKEKPDGSVSKSTTSKTEKQRAE